MSIENISARDLFQKLKNNPQELEIIDVREKHEYDLIHIKGSKLIPVDQLANQLDKINLNKEVVFVCRSGPRGSMAANLFFNLTKRNVKNLNHGIYGFFIADQNDFLQGNFLIKKEGLGKYFK